MSIPVHAPEGAYAAAAAELPLSVHRSESRAGSVVVVSGRPGWEARLDEAVAEGALGVILRDPQPGAATEPAGATEPTAARTMPALTIPVVVDRPLLRSDLVDDVRRGGTRPPALVQVECSGSGADFAAVARDALGWARVLAGGSLECVAARSTAVGFSALLLGDGDDLTPPVPVTVVATRRSGTAPWIRAIAVGVDRTEVTIDRARRSAVVERTGEAGRVIHPTRWESPERVVLRRALEALDAPDGGAELAEWRLDTALAACVLGIDPLG